MVPGYPPPAESHQLAAVTLVRRSAMTHANDDDIFNNRRWHGHRVRMEMECSSYRGAGEAKLRGDTQSVKKHAGRCASGTLPYPLSSQGQEQGSITWYNVV